MLQFLLLIADESDRDKVEYLYNRYHMEMIRIARVRLREKGVPSYHLDAEDVVQNAFVKIVKYIHKIDFTASDKSIRAYVIKIIVHEATDYAKQYKYMEDINEYADTMEDGDFFAQLRISQQYDDVCEALRSLDERYSITLSLRYVENMSVKEIADLLGLKEKCVYARLENGKKLLIEKLNGGMR